MKNGTKIILVVGVYLLHTINTIAQTSSKNLLQSPVSELGYWLFIAGVLLFVAAFSFWMIKKREASIREAEAKKTMQQELRATELQYRLETEKVINYFAHSMSAHTNVDDLLWDVVKNCISKLSFEDCVIYMLDEQNFVLVQKAAWGPKNPEAYKILNRIEIPIGSGIVGNVALTGRAEMIPNTSADERYIVDDEMRLSEIAVPIISHGKVIGVIDSEHPQKNFYTNRHLEILTTIAAFCADKIEKIGVENMARQKEIELLQLNQELATSRLTTLRSQMNPHFIYNALNSIQQYILIGNADQANRYLSKFSRLQREILIHSEFNFITLEKEMEMLNLYLQLEQLRLDNNLQYKIEISSDIDPSEIKLPPMVLQPFAENAIWHGLATKNGHRKLEIYFSLQGNNILSCSVKDNGIGREAAGRLGGQNGKTHTSKGLQLVNKRLELLRQQYNQPFEVSIHDVEELDGSVAGTEVKLLLYAGS